jgi:hypothetical protein
MATAHYLVGRAHDGLGHVGIEPSHLGVDARGLALDQRERGEQRSRHALVADGEVL